MYNKVEKDIKLKVIDVEKTGEKIKSTMKLKNFSIKEVANVLGIANGSVYHWFSGQSLPNLDNLVILSSLLECKIDDLIVTKELS